MIRLSTAAKLKERQMVKQIRLEKRNETKEVLTKDVTDDVFVTPADEKPDVVEYEAPEPKLNKRKKKLSELKKKKKAAMR